MSRALWTPQYYQKVLATDPIAYWMLDEKSGAVAYDLVSGRVAGAQNGTHVGVTLGQSGIGDGRTSPLYDGANDYTNVYSAALAAAFNKSEGTMFVWPRVSGAGVWTDSTIRFAFTLGADGPNRVFMCKTAANNEFRHLYSAAGTSQNTLTGGLSSTDFFNAGITWSVAADEVRAYLNGVQTGATLNGLDTWVGNLDATRCNVGSSTTAPASLWDGTNAHVAAWDRPLSPAEIAALAVRE